MSKAKPAEVTPKRFNRAMAVGDALGQVLDPALRKRGFANRELLSRWHVIVPAPFGEQSRPVKLSWSRKAGSEGATLEVSCHPGHALALQHDAPRLVAAINTYFGYVLLTGVRLSAEPFLPTEPNRTPLPDETDPAERRKLAEALGAVDNPNLRDALAQLGRAVLGRRRGGNLP